MGPGTDELDDEIRGHVALSVRERLERGEDPEAARAAALREFGNVLLARESMQAVWRPRWLEWIELLGHDLRLAARSLRHAKGLAATVAFTLALGIGANAAIFNVVRHVLFLPLVNRDEGRLVYVRQRAPGQGVANMTFSMPEIGDFAAKARTIDAFADFSTIDLTVVGLGEPRAVRAGVVSGSYFDVMGLRPALGRLLVPADDSPNAAGALVLTHRFWSDALSRDPAVVGRRVKVGLREARVVGVLEPAVPYPADTEVIANVVTSPHHLGATMVRERTHRMTELFGRLAPGATVETARAELTALHASMMRENPKAYPASAPFELRVRPLRDAITAPARNVLLALLAAAGVVFAVACTNVVNLVLARSVRRERELLVRAALGASRGALRRTLLAESLVLCALGAALGLVLARPLVGIVGRFAARFSVRALDVAPDLSLALVGAGLAMIAAVILAYVPRLPMGDGGAGLRGPCRGRRPAPGPHPRLRAFAVTQIALSFVLLTGAALVVATLLSWQRMSTGFDLRQVLAIEVPLPIELSSAKTIAFFEEATRRIARVPGASQVAVSNFMPWRDAGGLMRAVPFRTEGFTPAEDEEDPRARLRNVTPGFFAALGVEILAGRDFTDDDRGGRELVVIVSQSLAARMFPNGDALDRRLFWTDPYFGKPQPRRIVGVVADVDDENLVPGPSLTVYHPLRQVPYGGRLFVHAEGDPYALVAPVKEIIREISAEQPVHRVATLEDVRASVLAPARLNAFVFSGFAGVALLIAVVGVAGVLASTVSARTREFGVRLAVGQSPARLLAEVLSEGARIAAAGAVIGGALSYLALHLSGHRTESLPATSAPAVLGAAALLVACAVLASLVPALRAARVDVVQAIRTE